MTSYSFSCSSFVFTEATPAGLRNLQDPRLNNVHDNVQQQQQPRQQQQQQGNYCNVDSNGQSILAGQEVQPPAHPAPPPAPATTTQQQQNGIQLGGYTN